MVLFGPISKSGFLEFVMALVDLFLKFYHHRALVIRNHLILICLLQYLLREQEISQTLVESDSINFLAFFKIFSSSKIEHWNDLSQFSRDPPTD